MFYWENCTVERICTSLHRGSPPHSPRGVAPSHYGGPPMIAHDDAGDFVMFSMQLMRCVIVRAGLETTRRTSSSVGKSSPPTPTPTKGSRPAEERETDRKKAMVTGPIRQSVIRWQGTTLHASQCSTIIPCTRMGSSRPLHPWFVRSALRLHSSTRVTGRKRVVVLHRCIWEMGCN